MTTRVQKFVEENAISTTDDTGTAPLRNALCKDRQVLIDYDMHEGGYTNLLNDYDMHEGYTDIT